VKPYAELTEEQRAKHVAYMRERRLRLRAENRCGHCGQVLPDKRLAKIARLKAQIAALEEQVKP